MKRTGLLIILLLSAAFSTAQAQSFNLNQGLGIISGAAGALKPIDEKEEVAIGRDLAGRMLGAIALVDDANVQAYVNRVGRWIASQSERPDLPWRFGVANAGNINAMAMPGGTILITRGLYDLLDNEAQLAGVLGHEIAHVVKKHHINVMQNQKLVGVGANLAAARTGSNVLGQQALNFFKNLFISGLDKGAEFEADATGVILAARAGYNAFGLAEVLHKIGARGGKDPSVVDLFGSHPSPAERLTKLGELLAPRLANLPSGAEPDITPVSASAAAPRAGAAPATTGARALTNEAPAAPAEAPAQKPAAGGSPLDALKGLKGLFGR